MGNSFKDKGQHKGSKGDELKKREIKARCKTGFSC